jgi:hypothetical protein
MPAAICPGALSRLLIVPGKELQIHTGTGQAGIAAAALCGAAMNEQFFDTAQVRRATLFLVNIGVPVIVGLARREPDAALLGAVVGMLLALADNDGELFSRLRLLALGAGAISGGAIVGWLCRDSAAALWVVFVAITLSVGMAARGGREPLLTGRCGAMAFTVAVAIPTFDLYQIWYLLGVLALNAASRAVDQFVAGPLPLQPAAPLQLPSGQGGSFRFALCYSGAALASMWIGRTLDPVHTIWVVTATLLVMLPDARGSYRRIVERVGGTFAGAVAAWVVTMLFHSTAAIGIAILLVAPFIPHHLAKSYWLHTALIAFMVLLAYDLTLIHMHGIANLLTERLEDILLGCAIALVGTAVAFPREAAAEFDAVVEDR